MTIQITVTNNYDTALRALADGVTPIECSFGDRGVVDDLTMDHHGELSGLPSVALRAYCDHFGARAYDPRFIVAGTPDADATFSAAALAGLLPHPSRDTTGLPPSVAKAITRDLTALAETIAIIDTDPVGRDLLALPMGDVLLAWRALMAGTPDDDVSAAQGVALWRTLTSGHPAQRPLIEAGRASETARLAAAAEDLPLSRKWENGVFSMDGTRVFGFDVWYGRRPEFAPNTPAGWVCPAIIARAAHNNSVTIGCPNKEVAEALFGLGGLKNVYPLLGSGWGGREAVGGSPRGQAMSAGDVENAARILVEQSALR